MPDPLQHRGELVQPCTRLRFLAPRLGHASRSRPAAECWFDPRYDAGVIPSD